MLKHRWLCQPGSKKFTAIGGGDKFGQSIKQGSLVTLKLSCRLVTSGMTDICKCRVITVYEKSYNKWFITGENKCWLIDLTKNKTKEFKVEARIIDNKVLVYEDVPIDDHARLSKDIIRVVYSNMVIYVVGMLIRT